MQTSGSSGSIETEFFEAELHKLEFENRSRVENFDGRLFERLEIELKRLPAQTEIEIFLLRTFFVTSMPWQGSPDRTASHLGPF